MTVALAIVEGDRIETAIEAVIGAGRYAAARHWVPATSGNFSVRIDASRIAITRSGADKGALTRSDVLIQTLDAPLLPGSSAEAALHIRQYTDNPDIGAIFHAHGPYSTVIGHAHLADGAVHLNGWELQKALLGVTSHEATVEVPVFANDQNIDALSHRVAARLGEPVSAQQIRAPGYLLAGHGLYAWGKTPRDATRHLEALEVLFHQMIAFRSYQP
ncbi:methylthioribulose 1-phosphate dehydratase [Hyphomicrobium sp. 99]|uniref:methylthioribulose 1-phosphate dehydratase n=1 Tax=Hyphomicrobium sp. 99 TaxID=1163419 RepID=UPI0005F891CA|nr:methylthioribulose 1-phosphate dehydratase [Hyphomicrobium sp. 99]